ncbi:MAG TPA: TRAM domain-containing protein [Candidatus Saccharimonadales bacterium]|nr:TRAM domain-containing protein [Candidatus Saccharimonadales bacterium]
MEEVKIEKLVHGGQGLAQLADGRKVFVWNALPGETVRVRIIKKKHSYAEAIAEEIVTASPERIEPREENYLATSPWQIMAFEAENRYKSEIVKELFAQARVDISNFDLTAVSGKAAEAKNRAFSPRAMENPPEVFYYRNKMEYSFWGDDDRLHLALYRRGSHGKQIVEGSVLAKPELDARANKLVAQLSKLQVRAGDLKTIVVRCDQAGYVAGSLFVKDQRFPTLELPHGLRGLRVYFSDPKSPASVPTRLLYELGDVSLNDVLLDKEFTYDVDSFFQVNLPIFEQALARIKEHCSEASLTDMYAGVGTISLSVAHKRVNLIEFHEATAAMARVNAAASGLQANVVAASTEKALEYISGAEPVIFDPPRAGLHDKVVQRVLETRPPKVIYLSCNPATQARDLAKLQAAYEIAFFEVYNFFPRTPHIETLAIVELR